MTTVLLIRHGRTSANTAGVLAGRSSGVTILDAYLAGAFRRVARYGDYELLSRP